MASTPLAGRGNRNAEGRVRQIIQAPVMLSISAGPHVVTRNGTRRAEEVERGHSSERRGDCHDDRECERQFRRRRCFLGRILNRTRMRSSLEFPSSSSSLPTHFQRSRRPLGTDPRD
jgi:hypothetical protein